MFAIRWLVTDDATGETLHDETIPVEHDVLYGFEKGMSLLGRRATIHVEFDPPLTVVAEVSA